MPTPSPNPTPDPSEGHANRRPTGGADAAPAANAAPDAPAPGQRELVLVKHGQRYVFRYHVGHEAQMLRSLVEMVKDPASNIDWFDAAVLSHQMGQRIAEQIEALRKGARQAG